MTIRTWCSQCSRSIDGPAEANTFAPCPYCGGADLIYAVDVDSICINPGSSAYIDDLHLPAEYDAKPGDAK